MKNYYEILEVSEKASSEVIEKAYKALVKKYHPDLQPNDKKQDAENKIKVINEAYDILSNNEKRAHYDEELKRQKQKEEVLQSSSHTSTHYSNNNDTLKPIIKNKHTSTNTTKEKRQNEDLQKAYNESLKNAYSEAYSQAYNDAYINTLKSMGYKIKYKKTLKDHIRIFFSCIFTIIVFVIIGFIIWHIPFTKKYLIDLYYGNSIIKMFVDIIHSIFINLVNIFKK